MSTTATKKQRAEEAAPDHPLARCRPRGDRVVVRRDKARKESLGGIIIPDTFSGQRPQTGSVWAVGPGRTTDDGRVVPTGLKKGDRVVVTGYAGLEIRDMMSAGGADDEFVILREEDVLAVLD